MFKAEILADSLSPQGQRLTTMKITFPRFILAEFNTHRMFSRNSASSRAIPFNKMVQMVEENPFIPIAWQKDHKGMQGTEYFSSTCREEFGHLDRAFYNYEEYKNKASVEKLREEWLEARDAAVPQARALNYLGATKQIVNRLLEPFMWHTVIVTSGKEGLDNFFNLRCPQYFIPDVEDNPDLHNVFFKSKKDLINTLNKTNYGNYEGTIDQFKNMSIEEQFEYNKSQAEIHIQAIAELMWDAYNESEPKKLKAGEWHIPFGDRFSDNKIDMIFTTPYSKQDVEDYKIKIATARCARISYETLGDNPKIDYEADIKLHDALKNMEHWSPFEHVAKAMSDEEYFSYHKGSVEGEFDSQVEIGSFFRILEESKFLEDKRNGWCRNFRGFIQYRALVDV